jgi:hypothetical protein
MSLPTTLSGRPSPVRRAVLSTAAALAAAPVLLAGAAPAHAGPAAPEVPSTIDVVGDFKPYLVGHAVGWQVHTCKPTATGYAWSFDGPVATLHDDRGRLIATHSAGPTWTARDGSSVVGQLVDKVTVDASAIPWLLLRAASRTSGPDGSRLAETTHIQRINTTGGLTPAAAECTADHVGEQRSVPYTADYVFWKQTGAAA